MTSNIAPTVDIFSNTSIDTSAGDLLTWTGGCGTAASTQTLGVDTATELTLTTTGGSAFAGDGSDDGVYSCTLMVTDSSGVDSNILTLSPFTLDTTGPSVSVADTTGTIGTSISFDDNHSLGTTVATVAGTDTYATTLGYQEDGGGDTTANSLFDINGSTGEILLMSTPALGTYTYSVIVTDDAVPTNNTTTENVVFTITETNSAPVLDDTYVTNFASISEHISDSANVDRRLPLY